jgi:uncharacterized Zn finger protein
MPSGLIRVLTLQAVQELAGGRTFARGTAYFHGGAVGLLDADEYEVRASVQGTNRYHPGPRYSRETTVFREGLRGK